MAVGSLDQTDRTWNAAPSSCDGHAKPIALLTWLFVCCGLLSTRAISPLRASRATTSDPSAAAPTRTMARWVGDALMPYAGKEQSERMIPTKPGRERCAFCEKERRMVECLIAGTPGMFICNECVELCNDIIAQELQKKGKGIRNVRLGLSVVADRLRVVNVVEGGPAAKGGILVGDVLDHDVKSVNTAIADSHMDGQVVLNVRRGDTFMAVLVKLGAPCPECSDKEIQL